MCWQTRTKKCATENKRTVAALRLHSCKQQSVASKRKTLLEKRSFAGCSTEANTDSASQMSQHVGGPNENGLAQKRRRRGGGGGGRFKQGRRQGQCVSWHANNGWGFVRDDMTGVSYFCHHSAIRPQLFPKLGEVWYKNVLYTGEHVSYRVRPNPQDRSKLMCDEVTGPNGKTLLMDHAVMKVMEYRRYAPTHSHAADDEGHAVEAASELAPEGRIELAPESRIELAPESSIELAHNGDQDEQ